MDNSTFSNSTFGNDTVGGLSSSDITDMYQASISILVLVSSVAVVTYTAILSFGDEVDYIWSRRFSLPAFLYCLARYSIILSQALSLLISLLPDDVSLNTCNVIANTYGAISLLPYIGVQGLLVARAYSLYPGNIFVALVLGVSFFIGIFFGIYISAAFPGCSPALTSVVKVYNLIDIVATVLTDTLVFIVTLLKVWGMWRMRRQLSLGDGESNIGALLLSQGVSRYCFVLLVTLTNAILVEVGPAAATLNFSYMQEALSVIILCQFSLDLRRRNTPHIDDVELPTLSFTAQGARNVLRYVHETFITELGEPGDLQMSGNTHDEDPEFETIELRGHSDSLSSPTEISKSNTREAV